jgi:aldehyde dehydrogenase (NAD+)
VQPTVFGDVRDEMRIAQEEIFGPVASVMPFDSFEEVVARANATKFGLAGGVWTARHTRAHAAVRAIRAGSIWVNHYQAMDPAVPFGGYKMSGYGREGGSEHLDSYLNTKGVWIRLS